MLTGEYRPTLDDKGRLLFPSKMRGEILGQSLFVTQSVDGCLWLFPPEEWKAFSDKILQSASPFDPSSRLVLRRLVAPAQEIEFDKAGRLGIPQSLRSYAALERDCVLLGVSRYIELWDAHSYEEYLRENDSLFAKSAEALSGVRF